MFFLLDHPSLVFAACVTTFWIAVWIGSRFQKDIRFEAILAGVVTLLALIIGFTFSMAVSRYDQRKNYEEAEANAIGTEYVRADLLPVDDAAKVRELLRTYVNQRILFYLGDERWSRLAGQNGGLAKVDSGFDYAANFSSLACVA